MTTYRVNHVNGIARSDAPDLEQNDTWEDPPEHVLEAFGDRLDLVPEEDDEEEEVEEEPEEEEETEQEEEEAEEEPTEAELMALAEAEGRNAIRTKYAADIEEVDGNASTEDMIQQILDYYAED